MSQGSGAIEGKSPRALAKALETWHQEQFCCYSVNERNFFFNRKSPQTDRGLWRWPNQRKHVRKWCADVPKTVERTCKTNFAAVGPAHQDRIWSGGSGGGGTRTYFGTPANRCSIRNVHNTPWNAWTPQCLCMLGINMSERIKLSVSGTLFHIFNGWQQKE